MLIEGVGLGMFFSFLLSETLGLAAGGIVVPGYFALTLSEPFRVFSTILLGIVCALIAQIVSSFIILYGRRLFLFCVVLGYLLGYLTKIFPALPLKSEVVSIETIGYVIPGLLAYWINRQGIIETLSSLTVVAILVRFLLIILSQGRLPL
ncbi:MAG: poly-gamma-glutamate biosynthesis protein PgsC [candidate division WOR-3 bacterium]